VSEESEVHREFLTLLAPYDLRDGHNPGQPFAGERSYVGRGWHGLVKELIEDLIKIGWDREVLQIKEKLGTLRFHIKDRRPEYLVRIEAAGEHSGETCELCGKAGGVRVSQSGWYYSRCDACWQLERRRLERE
jgi:hypothetical protein